MNLQDQQYLDMDQHRDLWGPRNQLDATNHAGWCVEVLTDRWIITSAIYATMAEAKYSLSMYRANRPGYEYRVYEALKERTNGL